VIEVAKRPHIRRWVLTPHAAERARERRISMPELEQIIAAPDLVMPQGPKWILAKRFPTRSDNRLAAVLMEKQKENLWVVITVMVRFDEKNV
jgi:hypothetical protein